MIVALEHLRKSFGPGAPAVDDVSFRIEPGEMFFLLGPSGCGKTTVLRMVAGFVTPDVGDILFDGRRMNDVPAQHRQTAMVFQSYAIWPHLTVYENVAYGLRVQKLSAAELDGRVREALRLARLEALAPRKPAQLSGGEQQRVALARALAVRPGIILLDEPLSNLDARLRLDLREELRRVHLETKITCLYVTHDQDEALSLASRLAVMNRGKIEQIGTPREVYERPASEFVARFMGETNWLAPGSPLAAQFQVPPGRFPAGSGDAGGGRHRGHGPADDLSRQPDGIAGRNRRGGKADAAFAGRPGRRRHGQVPAAPGRPDCFLVPPVAGQQHEIVKELEQRAEERGHIGQPGGVERGIDRLRLGPGPDDAELLQHHLGAGAGVELDREGDEVEEHDHAHAERENPQRHVGTDEMKKEGRHGDVENRVAREIRGIDRAEADLQRKIMVLVLQRMATLVGRHANVGGRRALVIFGREDELLRHGIVMVAEKTLTLDDLDVVDPGPLQDARGGLGAGQSRGDRDLPRLGVDTLQISHRPQRQEHGDPKDDPVNQAAAVSISISVHMRWNMVRPTALGKGTPITPAQGGEAWRSGHETFRLEIANQFFALPPGDFAVDMDEPAAVSLHE
jgi:ABC-type sulfate/molybdate transport systems ATPase subunit